MLQLTIGKMVSTLVKIPFIWAAMFALHVAATPPNPPASKKERTLSTKHESFMNKHLGRAVVEVPVFSASIVHILM